MNSGYYSSLSCFLSPIDVLLADHGAFSFSLLVFTRSWPRCAGICEWVERNCTTCPSQVAILLLLFILLHLFLFTHLQTNSAHFAEQMLYVCRNLSRRWDEFQGWPLFSVFSVFINFFRVQSCVAGALVRLQKLPAKLNPVIRPTMESIRSEEHPLLRVKILCEFCAHVWYIEQNNLQSLLAMNYQQPN